MQRSIQCPVCQHGFTSDAGTRCPGCGSDLTALVRLRQLPAACYNQALARHAAGDADGALEQASLAAALAPAWVEARVLLGKLLWAQGRQAAARDAWREARRRAPEDPTPVPPTDEPSPGRRFTWRPFARKR